MSHATRSELDIGSGCLEYLEIEGDRARAPLVLLHEGLGCVALWRDFPATLQSVTGRRVLVFSRFGHGRSSPPPHPRTPAFFHEEALKVLPQVLAALNAPEPILVGHSDGASIALIHAAHHRVTGLVLMAPHVIVEDICIAAIEETKQRYLEGDLRPRLARYHSDVDAAFHGWCDVWLDPVFRPWSLQPETQRVSAPTLLIQSRQDPYGTLQQLDVIERWCPAPVSRLVVTGGHSPHIDAPGEVTPAIASFVDHVGEACSGC